MYKKKDGYYRGSSCKYKLIAHIEIKDNSFIYTPEGMYFSELTINNNEQHRYYPDFELANGTIIEIKGYANKQTGAKINSVKDRPIKVLYWKDLQYAFDYVKSTYMYDNLEDLYE